MADWPNRRAFPIGRALHYANQREQSPVKRRSLDFCPHNSYITKIPLAKGRLSRGYSLGRSGSGSRRARPYTALAGGLGIVPSGACRTARCSLHWCRRGSSRLHPVVPGSAARAEPRVKSRMPRWGAERRARPLHFEVSGDLGPPAVGGQERGLAPHRLSMRLLFGALLGAPPPFLFGGDYFVAFVVPHSLALSARTKALVFPLPLARAGKRNAPP